MENLDVKQNFKVVDFEVRQKQTTDYSQTVSKILLYNPRQENVGQNLISCAMHDCLTSIV